LCQCQCYTIIGPFIVDKGNAIVYDRDISLGNVIDWFVRGQGGILKGTLAEGTWAITTDSAKRDGRLETPNIHAYILSMAVTRELESGASRSFNLKPSIAKYMGLSKGQDSFVQLVTLNKPLGYGYLKLRDNNPYSTLLIDPKYLENEKDFEALVEGIISIRLQRDLTNTFTHCYMLVIYDDSWYLCSLVIYLFYVM